MRRDYPRCGARRRQQPDGADEVARCGLAAGWGTPDAGTPGARCKLHGGRLPNLRQHVAALRVERDAEKALRQLREGPIVSPSRANPAEVLLSTVTEQAILVAYLRRRIETEIGERWVGDKMAATAQGDLYEVSEEERALVRMYREALGDLNRMSKVAHEAGVAEAVLRIEDEKWGFVLRYFIGALKTLGLEPEQIATLRKGMANAMRADAAKRIEAAS